MNIASHRISPVPVDASSSAPGDRASGWKWGLFIFYTDSYISRKAKSSSFFSDVVIEDFDAAPVTSVSRRCRPLVIETQCQLVTPFREGFTFNRASGEGRMVVGEGVMATP